MEAYTYYEFVKSRINQALANMEKDMFTNPPDSWEKTLSRVATYRGLEVCLDILKEEIQEVYGEGKEGE